MKTRLRHGSGAEVVSEIMGLGGVSRGDLKTSCERRAKHRLPAGEALAGESAQTAVGTALFLLCNGQQGEII